MPAELILPDWPAPPQVRALVTSRALGDMKSAAGRARLRAHLPADPVWLRQVHGVTVVEASKAPAETDADASFTATRNVVCAVMAADCLPVLLCDDNASVVAAIHAGWRGLADGVIEASVAAMAVPGERLMAWLGPAIGPAAFEVGAEVRDAFLMHDRQAAQAFTPIAKEKWLCDIYLLARQRLQALNIRRITSAEFPGYCTVRDIDCFYSFRRDGVTGRMASCIWLE